MKGFQRLFCLILTGCMLLSLVACGSKQPATTPTGAADPTASAASGNSAVPTEAPGSETAATLPAGDVTSETLPEGSDPTEALSGENAPSAEQPDPNEGPTEAPGSETPATKWTVTAPTQAVITTATKKPAATATNTQATTATKAQETAATKAQATTATKAQQTTATKAQATAATKKPATTATKAPATTATKAQATSATKKPATTATKAPATTATKAPATTATKAPATSAPTAAPTVAPSAANAPTSLILNKGGSYGGSLNKSLYGEGAPLNGQYDVKNSDYYTVNNDYYNMTSTEERVIIPHFKSYQQTMQDSSGLACLLMILNYMGQDTQNTYTEEALVKKYEEVNGAKVYGKGTTEEGLVKLVEALGLGYTATNTVFKFSGSGESTRQKDTKKFFTDAIKEGKFILVRYQSPVGHGWKLIVGYDTLGNVWNTAEQKEQDAFGDDVIIFAEPYDGADHYQDGFTTERMQDFYAWWKDMSASGKVTADSKWSYVLIDPNLDLSLDYQPVDETVKQTLYELHLPRNPNGGYGGTRNYKLYGSITSGNGKWNHTESNYYKINDFYNMGSEGSRVLLKNYTVLQQTMHSSCGICAVTSVLKYYGGIEESYYDMELSYLETYLEVNELTTITNKGTGVTGNAATLTEMGYTAEYSYANAGSLPKYATYEEYAQFVRDNLKAGRPIVVSTYLGSGHYLTVIGYDDMGTDYIYDDVIITADSCDYWDGYQDGYNVFSAYKFYRQHTNSSHKYLQSLLVIYKKES